MAEKRGKRKLTAIMSADVVGYSRLMEDEEETTVSTITEYREVIVGYVEKLTIYTPMRHKFGVTDFSKEKTDEEIDGYYYGNCHGLFLLPRALSLCSEKRNS
jgi:hypothetical protein